MSAIKLPQEVIRRGQNRDATEELNALQRIYKEAQANTQRLAEIEFETEEALERQDLALDAQMHVLDTASRLKCLTVSDVITKFNIWMEDYRGSSQDLSPESESLILAIYLDLKHLAESE